MEDVAISREIYLAGYYDLQYCIGRVIQCNGEKVKVKFLKKDLDRNMSGRDVMILK